MSSTTPAGWYPDPEREGATRWWDGAQWAPSEEPASSGDDRFRPRDDADASATSTTDAETPTTWGTQDAGQGGASWSQPVSSWGQQDQTPSWDQQGQAPSWGQQGGALPAASGQWEQGGAQQWNQYETAPRKSRTGLVLGIVGGVLLLGLLLVVGGIVLAVNLVGAASQSQSQTQGGSTGGGTTTSEGITAPGSFEVSVPQDGVGVAEIVVTTAGDYRIDAVAVNGEDPRIELTGNGQSWEDDDSGDGLDSRLDVFLDAGTYSIAVDEFGGDPLVAEITVAER